nr:GNAT family protein [Ardenticatena sp.]
MATNLFPRLITLKTGETARLRTIREADAADVLRLVQAVATEEVFIGVEANTLPRSVEEERRFIRAALNTPRRLFMGADVKGRIVGTLSLSPGQFGRKDAHLATLGIVLAPRYRGVGLGGAMLDAAIEWARTKAFEKIQLEVFATNERAIALYRRKGFVEEGRRRRAYKLRGEYVDGVLMGLWIGDEHVIEEA